MRNPYSPALPALVFVVFANGGSASLNLALAVMAAGEDTGDMVYSLAAAAVNIGCLLYVKHTLEKEQRKVAMA